MASKLLTLSDGQILAVFSPDEWERWQGLKAQLTALEPAVLAIPHLAQFGPGADARRNDCGAACVAMIVRGLTEGETTVDDVAIRFQARENKYMGIGELLIALRSYGLEVEYKRPMMAATIEQAIRAGKPVIVLVKYPKLPHQATLFMGSHFVVFYGVNEAGLLYHDPLEGSDAPLTVTAQDLDTALNGFEPGENLPYQGIVVGNS